jgi:hypothetical protein
MGQWLPIIAPSLYTCMMLSAAGSATTIDRLVLAILMPAAL